MKEVPVMVAEGWTDAQKRAYVIADNKLAMNAGWDDEMLRLELAEIDADGFDLGMTGFDADELAKIMFGEISEPDMPEEQTVPSAYEVSVSCDSEAEQERVYEMLTKQGLQCRVLTM
jgi:ParB-like chromosome segregation protein Spo0J